MLTLEKEKELVEELAKGSREAFRELYMFYYPKVRYFIFGLLKCDEETDDLTQEVFIKLWTNRERFNEVNSFGSYLYVLAKHTSLNFIEYKQIRSDNLNKQRPTEDDSTTPYEELVARDLQLLVDMVVENMPVQRRKIYRLSRESGMSNADIAEQLNLSKKTVENHLNMALKELKNAMSLLLILYLC